MQSTEKLQEYPEKTGKNGENISELLRKPKNLLLFAPISDIIIVLFAWMLSFCKEKKNGRTWK